MRMNPNLLLTGTTLVLSALCATRIAAQTLGPAQTLTVTPQIKPDLFYLAKPVLLEDVAVRMSRLDASSKDPSRSIVWTMALDGSGQIKEFQVTAPSLPNEHRIIRYFNFKDQRCLLAQDWDKKTGIVDLYIQACDGSLVPEGEVLKFGTINLKQKEYVGEPLNVIPRVSEDGSKVLLYFDEIEVDNFKMAMCWVLGTSFVPIWNGSYKLPVQAYKAISSVDLLENGSVSVAVKGIPVGEDNVREKSDGSTKAKVNQAVRFHDQTTMFVLFDKVFLKVDAKSIGLDAIQSGQILDSGAGWVFACIAENGGKAERIFGTLSTQGATIADRVPVESEESDVLLDVKGFFFVCHWTKENLLTMTKLTREGDEVWHHTAPYVTFRELQVVNGHVINYNKVSKGALDQLRKGESVRREAEEMSTFPFVTVWNNGERTLHSLVPDDSGYAEMYITMYDISGSGLIYKRNKQKDPSLTFTPFVW